MARRRNIFSVEIDPTTKLSETSVGATVSDSTDEGIKHVCLPRKKKM
jgi:hypothetical protein